MGKIAADTVAQCDEDAADWEFAAWREAKHHYALELARKRPKPPRLVRISLLVLLQSLPAPLIGFRNGLWPHVPT